MNYLYICAGTYLFLLLFILPVLVGVLCRQLIKRHMIRFYAVKDPKGIEALESINVGGFNQWLHIRGRNKENPILLFVHGGPGLPQIGWFDAMQRPWEDFFTVVQWDQRQTGKSYASMAAIGDTLTNERMIQDTEEVICHLRDRFDQEKIFIMGFSYGTYLSMHMVKRHPDWLHAYISLGQSVNVIRSIEIEYELLLGHAKENNDKQLVEKLEAIAPRIDMKDKAGSFLKHSGLIFDELAKIGKGVRRHMSQKDVMDMITVERWISPHLTLRDLLNPVIGDGPALGNPNYGFAEEFMDIDLPAEVGRSFDVPIYLFAGAHDWHIPITQQKEWFDSITAPHKELVLFEESAHLAVHKEPGRFLLALVTKVLPIATMDKLAGDDVNAE